jgi:hypothetical protein
MIDVHVDYESMDRWIDVTKLMELADLIIVLTRYVVLSQLSEITNVQLLC